MKSDDLARAFDHVAALLTRALGAPTDTRSLHSFTQRRHAWTTTPPRLMHDTHAVVVLDSRGVVLWASGPGTAFHGRLHTPHMGVAASPDLVTRIERSDVRCPTVATVEEAHLYTRERWRGTFVRTTPEVAVEAVRALVQGDLARESTEGGP